MEFKDYLKIFKKRFLWFILPALAVICVSFVLQTTHKTWYVFKATIYVYEELSDLAYKLSTQDYVGTIKGKYANYQKLLSMKSPETMYQYAQYYKLMEITRGFEKTYPNEQKSYFSSLEEVNNLLKKYGVAQAEINTLKDEIAKSISFNLIGGPNLNPISIEVLSKKTDEKIAKNMLIAVLELNYLIGLEEASSSIKNLLNTVDNNLTSLQNEAKNLQEKMQKYYGLLTYELSVINDYVTNFIRTEYSLKDKLANIERDIKELLDANPELKKITTPRGNNTTLPREEDIRSKLSNLQNKIDSVAKEIKELARTRTPEHPEIQQKNLTYVLLEEEKQETIKALNEVRYRNLLLQKQNIQKEIKFIQSIIPKKKEEILKWKEQQIGYQTAREELKNVQKTINDLFQLKQKCKRILEIKRGFVEIPIGKQYLIPEKISSQTGPFALWLILAIITGIVSSCLREYLDTTINTEHDIRKYANWEVLGIVPKLPFKQPIELATLCSSPFFEVFHMISAVISVLANQKGNIICVTSSIRSEGKTLVTAALGIALGQKNYKTVIVDADFRAPRIASLFHLDVKEKGYNHWVKNGSVELMSSLVQSHILSSNYKNLYFLLPSGPYQSPYEFFELPQFKALLETLKISFDYILIDTPPILSVSDSLLIAKAVDYTLIVIKASTVDRKSIRWAKHLVETVTPNIIGTILNSSSELKGEGYYYYYYYYHKK